MSRPQAITHNDESVETKSTWLLKMFTINSNESVLHQTRFEMLSNFDITKENIERRKVNKIYRYIKNSVP